MKCNACDAPIGLHLVTYCEVDVDNKENIKFTVECIFCGAIHFAYIDPDNMIETLGG